MSLLVIIVIALVAAALVGVLVTVGMKASKLAEELEHTHVQVDALNVERRALLGKVDAMQDAERNMIRQLDHADQEITHYREQLDQRPETKRKIYRILALGIKATGKTSLTLKWANPLTDLCSISGTKIERYERSVSRVQSAKELTEHVFEVHDWGGEHLVDAVQELVSEEVHGLLLVVDLGGKDATTVDHERVKMQLREFQPQALQYYFVPKMMATCKTVVLFINKSDLIKGTPAEVEGEAKRLYQPLIDALSKYANQIDVKVLVGSANHGHSTHLLFGHFIEKILPKNAHDDQLLQRTKSTEGSVKSTTAPLGIAAPPLPPMESIIKAPSFGRFPPPRQITLRGPGDTAPLVSKSNGIAKHFS